jgi:hypothetical protein
LTLLIESDCNGESKGRGKPMPCRVGITTDPDARRAYWQNQVVGFTNWRILKSFKRRAEAQEYETQYAARYECQAALGGADASGIYSMSTALIILGCAVEALAAANQKLTQCAKLVLHKLTECQNYRRGKDKKDKRERLLATAILIVAIIAAGIQRMASVGGKGGTERRSDC